MASLAESLMTKKSGPVHPGDLEIEKDRLAGRLEREVRVLANDAHGG